jgi:hypothetical protein
MSNDYKATDQGKKDLERDLVGALKEQENNIRPYMGDTIKKERFGRMLERGDKVRINGVAYKVTFVDKALGKMFLRKE